MCFTRPAAVSVLLVSSCLTSVGTLAQDKKDPQAAVEPRSQPGAGQKFLEKFIGDWHVVKTFYPASGEPVTTEGDCRRMLRVVVADDCRDTADSLATLMRFWGHDVRVAYSGAAVLEITSTYRPDVLLLDVAMPHMDGFVLARNLRRLASIDDALLVAITGYGDHAHRLLGAEAGFDFYLVKPVEPSTLEQLLQLKKRHILIVDEDDCVSGVLSAALQPGSSK